MADEIKQKVILEGEDKLTPTLNQLMKSLNDFEKKLNKGDIKLKINQGQWDKSIDSANKKLITKLTGNTNKVTVIIDADKLNNSVDKANKILSKLKNVNVNVNTDARSITTKIQNISGRLDTLSKKKYNIDGNINTTNAESKIIRLATYINQLNSKDIKPKVDEGISNIVKLSTYLNQLKSKDLSLVIDANISKAKSGIMALYKMVTELVGKKYKLDIDTNNLTGKNSQLKTTANTLNNIGKALKNIKSKTINIGVNTGSGRNNISSAIRNIRSLNNLLQSTRNNIIINIRLNDNNNAIVRLRELSQLLRDIRRNSNLRIRTGYSGGGGGFGYGSGYGEPSPGNFLVGVVQFFGRASKGFGSALEALARVSQNMIRLGGTVGRAGVALAGITATAATVVIGFNIAINSVREFGEILLQVGTAIYKALKPGIDLYNQRTRAELALGAGARSMATIDGRQITDEESKSIGRQLTSRAIRDAARSVFNPAELIDAMQGTMPMLYARGMTAEQAYQTTKGVASVAKLGRLAPNQVLQETRDLAQGSITARTSQVANLLGITNEDLAQYKGNADALYDYLMDKFREYSKALDEYAKTPVGAFEQLQETIAIAGDSIVSDLAQPFVEVFHTITASLGSFVDEQGHVLDENGQYLDEYGNKVDGVGDIVYQVSEPLQNFADALEEIIRYLIQAIDELVEYSGIANNSKSVTQMFVDVMKFLIDSFVTSVKLLRITVSGIINFGKTIEWVAVPVLEFLYRMINLVRIAFSGWEDLFTLIGGATGNLSVEDVKSKLIANEKLRQELAAENERGYASKFTEFLEAHGFTHTSTENALTKAYDAGRKRYEEESKRGKGESQDLNKVQGKGTAESKANKEAIKQSQKALKEHIRGLKEALKDHIDELKEIQKERDIAYKEGFTSIKDYFTQKAELEAQEAQLRLEEAQEELIALKSAQFENEYDRLKELHSVEREISKYSRAVEKTTRQQKEVARNMERAIYSQNKLMNMYSKIIRGGSSLQQAQTSGKVGSVASSTQKKMESFAKEHNIEEWIADEILNTSQKYANAHIDAESLAKLVMAVMMQESGGNMNAVSSVGALGLMQLMPDTAEGLGVNPYDWKENIEGGVKYLSQLTEMFKGDTEKALAAYNAGAQAVIDYGGIPPYRETQNYVPSVQSYLADINNQQVKDAGVAIGAEVATGIYEAIDIALNRDGYLGQTLENGTVACVEAGTKLGAYYSDAFKEAVERGIVNTDVLDAFFDEKGIPSIPWEAGKLNPGDIIFFDGEQENQHVMLFKGNGMVAGNFSSGNDYRGAVGQQSLEDYLKYSGLTPTHIRQTGTYGLASGFSQISQGQVSEALEELVDTPRKVDDILKYIIDSADSVGVAHLEIANTTELASEALSAFRSLNTDTINLMSEFTSRIYGNVQGKLIKLINDTYNDISKHRSGSEADTIYLRASLDNFNIKVLDTLRENFESILDFNLSDIERNAKFRATDIYTGEYSFNDLIDRYSSYLTDESNPNGLASSIKKLRTMFVTYASKGFLKEAVDIRNKLESAKESLYEIFNSWIEQGQKYFDNAEAIFNATSRFTPTQREFAEREFNAYRAQSEYENRVKLGKQIATDYASNLKDINRLTKLNKELAKDSEDYKRNQLEINNLISDNKKLEALSLENEQMKKLADLTRQMPDYLDDIGKAARDALDNGLVEFLTDGILEAESLGDALRNLATGILKEIQQVSAKWIVKDLMNSLFGRFNVEEETPTSIPYAPYLTTINETLVTGFNGLMSAITGVSNTGVAGTGQVGLGVFSKPWEQSELNPNRVEENIFDVNKWKLLSDNVQNTSTHFDLLSSNANTFGNGLSIASSTLDSAKKAVEASTVSEQVSEALQQTENANAQAKVVSDTSAKAATDSLTNSFTRLNMALNGASTSSTGFKDGGILKLFTGGILKLAKGGTVYHNNGLIRGAGTSTSDSIPAMLSNGEAVLNAKAVRELGTNFITAVNNGNFSKIRANIPHFADGGFTGDAYQGTARGMTDFAKNIGANVTTNNQMNIALVEDRNSALEHFMRSPKGQNILVDFMKGNGRVFSRFNKSV